MTVHHKVHVHQDAVEQLKIELIGVTGVISLSRPERLNALTTPLLKGLLDAFKQLSDTPGVGSIILRGEGRSFCAGLDLDKGLVEPGATDGVLATSDALSIGADLVWTMRAIPQPIIAVVQGHSVGAGFSLAAAADVRFLNRDARFSAPFLKLGVSVGDLGLSWFFPRIVGLTRANMLFYGAGVLEAERAVEWGFATHISASPYVEALEFAERIGDFAPYGVGSSKALLNSSQGGGLRAHLEAEARAQALGTLTEAAVQALNSARERA